MSAVVMLSKFEFNLTYVAVDSPAECTLMGSVLAVDEDNALERIEDTYATMAHRLKCIRVQRAADANKEAGEVIARYHFSERVETTIPEEQKPKFRLQDVKGLTEHYDYFDVDVVPFTYKEKSNEQ